MRCHFKRSKNSTSILNDTTVDRPKGLMTKREWGQRVGHHSREKWDKWDKWGKGSGNSTTCKPTEEKDSLISPVFSSTSVDPLRPSSGECKVLFPELPKIVLTYQCYTQLMDWARCFAGVEVSVFGKVERKAWLFRIVELYFPKQACHSATTEPELVDLYKWLRDQGREAEVTTNNSWLFWGHFHPGSSASPSGQDTEQMRMFESAPYFIRGIFARTGGEAQFFIQDCTGTAKLCVDKVAWTYEECPGKDPKVIEAEMAGKVRRIGYSNTSSGTGYSTGRYQTPGYMGYDDMWQGSMD